MQRLLDETLAIIFGLIFIALALIVTVETMLRKLLNVSLQGADELGGYALAVGSTIAFAIAMAGRNHIRVDILHGRLPARLQAWMNWLSVSLMALFSTLLAALAWRVIMDTLDYRSVAQTPWATPLIYPQSAWFAGILVFALVSLAGAARASWLLLRGRTQALVEEFQPRSVKEELDDELADLSHRFGGDEPGRPS